MHISICVQNKHIYAYKTRIYLRTKRAYTGELLVLLAGITNSIQKILIRKQGEKQGVVSYCKTDCTEINSLRFKADFHSVQNIARSIFSERFLLKCVKSSTANEICSA